MRVLFMGTPDFAASTLQKLIDEKYEIAGVFTQPDKPVGRKHIITPSDVKVLALENNLDVYQPSSIRDEASYNLIKELNPDVCVVVAYGKIIPQNVLDIPKYGFINIHASILPYYRGASPIQWAIVCGEKETGVTSMQLDAGMDTGDILLCEKTEIGDDETAEQLWDRLSVIGASLAVKTLIGLEKGSISPLKQDNEKATYAPIIKKTDGLIDWNDSAQKIKNKVRGLHSWPVAYTIIDNKMLKIFNTNIVENNGEKAGTIIEKDKRLVISCGENALEILELQLEGSKRMMTNDFLRGKKITADKI